MAPILNPLAVQRAPRQGRVMRRPNHKWNVRAQPWQIQPICIAPVIPGETLKNAVLQARVVSDPVANRLIGWWHEYYFYYVPFRALSIADELTQMVVDPEFDAQSAGITSNTVVANHYFYGRHGINFVKECLDAVVAYDFRKPDYTGTHEIDGLPVTTINNENWTNSLIADSLMESFDQNVDVNSDGTIMASEVDIAMQQYELLKANGLIEMTYEDYLKTYGIRGRAVEKTEEWTPELIRYIRDWTYPSNTVDGEGNVSSALSWSIAERIDKDRFFREPGFIFGVTVSRPKVYLGRQVGAAVSMMDNIRAWLPKVLTDDPYTSLMRFEDAEGPMQTGFDNADASPGNTQAYWVDVRDLLLYGDQFVYEATPYTVPLPATDGNLQFPTSASVAALFAGDAKRVEQDGLISFVIAGSQRDFTTGVHNATVLSA